MAAYVTHYTATEGGEWQSWPTMQVFVRARFVRDADVIRCRECGRRIHESRTAEPMHHRAGCSLADLEDLGFNPWHYWRGDWQE
jgi:hypothetical protein